MRVHTRDIAVTGLGHTVNEDSRFVAEDLIVVADGMGGEVDGDIASGIAVETISAFFAGCHDTSDRIDNLEDNLYSAIFKADEEIRKFISSHPYSKGMGTTVIVAVPHGNVLTIAWCGDCRCFRFRDGDLLSITKDHSFVQELVDDGSLSPDDVFGHPDSNLITRFVGGGIGVCLPEITSCDILPGDIFILCSDGLSGYVHPDKIKECVTRCAETDALPERLSQLALRYGSEDDITIVTLNAVMNDDTSSPHSIANCRLIRLVKRLLYIRH